MDVGDIVKLRGGSPKMTIVSIEEDGNNKFYARCAWFTRGDSSKLATEFEEIVGIGLDALVKVEEE